MNTREEKDFEKAFQERNVVFKERRRSLRKSIYRNIETSYKKEMPDGLEEILLNLIGMYKHSITDQKIASQAHSLTQLQNLVWKLTEENTSLQKSLNK